ncbi:MAG: radical SAM protein [Candidatus Omnitrophota bacterium]
MKLLLIFPNWCTSFGVFKNIAKKASSFPPLGLCYIAAIAEKCGWEVKIIDGEIDSLSIPDIIKQTANFDPDLIGLTATTPFFYNVAHIARNLKSHFPTPIIVGGPHPSLLREKAFLDVFDYLFIGEAEKNLPDFLKSFAQGREGRGIAGIMRRENGKIHYTSDPPKTENLDEIPWPARHLIPYKKYSIGTLQGTKNYTSLFMSRGCPFDCVFCANDLYGKRVRSRAVKEVIREISYIVHELGIPHIYFLDDTLTLDRPYILSLCEEIKKNRLRFTFEGSTRANLWDEEMVRLMKDCGLIRISFGLETVDQHVRKIIKKNVPIRSYMDANRLNERLNIETINSVMLGLPGENLERIQKTVNYLTKAKFIQHATYGIAIPYPGTEMYQMAKNQEHGLKLISDDFEDYQRYGKAVMEVGGLKPQDIVYLQKIGLIKIYARWWRLWPIIKRHGLKALFVPVVDAFVTVIQTLCSKFSGHKSK